MWQRLAILLFLLLSVSLAQGAPTTPTTDFIDNNDGTVTHKITGLMWKRCAEGMTWTGSTCTGTVLTYYGQEYSWAQATVLTSTFAGKSDWRLPTITELETIVEHSTTNPSINGTIFPNTNIGFFWSATSDGVSDGAWNVYFGTGKDNYYNKVSGMFVRLVRTAPLVSLFSISCPNTINANAGGSCSATANYSDASSKAVSPTWSSSNPTALSVNSSGSLTSGAPSSDTPVTITATYSEGGASKTATTTVTVKVAITLKGLSATCPSTISAGASGSCFATASYSDDTSKAASPTWSSSNPTVLSVNGGSLTAGTPVSDTPVTITANYSEGGINKSATATVIVKAAPPILTSLSITGSTTVNAGSTAQFFATAGYSDSSSKGVIPIWSVSGSGASIDSNGLLTTGAAYADNVVTVMASYTESTVTKTFSKSVTISAPPPPPILTLSCPATMNAGSTASCSAMVGYANNTSKPVSANWSSSNPSVLGVNGGVLTAGNVITDTPVTLTAGYTENGVTKTATCTVTVKAAPPTLSSLSISGVTSLPSGQSASLSASAIYTNGTSKNVTGNVTWGLVGIGATIDAAGTITAQNVTADTSVTITASYSENGQPPQTAKKEITVQAVVTLTGLELACPAVMTSSSSGNCSAMAVYSDGKKTAVTTGTWSVSPSSAATLDASGKVTAAKVSADTPITVHASYTENGKTVTADKTITLQAAPCLANTGEISISGAAVKKLGESVDVRYRLCNFNKATKFDVYVAVQIPDEQMLFLSTSGFFGTPTFSLWDGESKPPAYLANTLVPDLEGAVLNMPVMPLTLPTGTYTFYAIPVLTGKDVMKGFNWVGSMAKSEVSLIK